MKYVNVLVLIAELKLVSASRHVHLIEIMRKQCCSPNCYLEL